MEIAIAARHWRTSCGAVLAFHFALVALAGSVVDALLLSDSSIVRCERSSAADLACTTKLVATLTVESGQLAGVEELLFFNATDTTGTIGDYGAASDNGQGGAARAWGVVEFQPITVTVQKTDTLARYPVFYQQNFNVEPYEFQIISSVASSCSASSTSSSPTCGRAYDRQGNRVPYSEGFCCNCNFCELLGLCTSVSRARLGCSIFNDIGAASCLRYGDRWYSGYAIGSAYLWYRIRIHLSRGNGGPDRNTTESATLELSYERKGDRSDTFGAMANLVGDFVSPEAAMDLSSKMLFVPSMPLNDARRGAGAAEWMLVDRSEVTMNGLGCNKVGISHEGFYRQAERCRMEKGTCLGGQLEQKRASDRVLMSTGRRGNYMVSNFGEFSIFDAQAYSSTAATALRDDGQTTTRWSVMDRLAAYVPEASTWDGSLTSFDELTRHLQRAMDMDNESFSALLAQDLDALRLTAAAQRVQRERTPIPGADGSGRRGCPGDVGRPPLSRNAVAPVRSTMASVSPDISYRITSAGSTVITLVLRADHLRYTAAVSTGVIAAANMTLPVVAASSRDGVLEVTITNTGSIASNYAVTVTDCIRGTFPVPQQVRSLAPGQNGTARFNVYFQDVTIQSTTVAHCTVQLIDMRNAVIDTQVVLWNATVVEFHTGAQGGNANNTGPGVAVHGDGRRAACSACPFYNPLCFLSNKCVWQVVMQIVTVLLIILAVALVLFFRRPIFAALRALARCCASGYRGRRRYSKDTPNADIGSDLGATAWKSREPTAVPAAPSTPDGRSLLMLPFRRSRQKSRPAVGDGRNLTTPDDSGDGQRRRSPVGKLAHSRPPTGAIAHWSRSRLAGEPFAVLTEDDGAVCGTGTGARAKTLDDLYSNADAEYDGASTARSRTTHTGSCAPRQRHGATAWEPAEPYAELYDARAAASLRYWPPDVDIPRGTSPDLPTTPTASSRTRPVHTDPTVRWLPVEKPDHAARDTQVRHG